MTITVKADTDRCLTKWMKHEQITLHVTRPVCRLVNKASVRGNNWTQALIRTDNVSFQGKMNKSGAASYGPEFIK